ncbi:hypothetical protein IAT38_001733 [Cryptococcus sp. DSM 104549]
MDVDYQYRCEHPGCNKAFTRKDHLIRHSANHSLDTFDCPKCSRQFKRPDLLQRHAKRMICGDDLTSSLSKRQRSGSESEDPSPRPIRPPPPLIDTSYAATAPPSAATSIPPSATASMFAGPPPPPPPQHTLPPLTTTTELNGDGRDQQLMLGAPPHAGPSHTASTSIAPAPPLHPHPDPAVPLDPINPHADPSSALAAAPADLTNPDFVIGAFMGDWGGTSFWAPEQWEALLAPPFNEPIVDLAWELPVELTRGQAPESAERGAQNDLATGMLVARLQRSFPEFDVSLSWVLEALSLYWTRTAPTFPFIHRGTFDINAAPSELVCMMAIVGSVHMSPRRDFSRLVQKIRGALVQECGFDMPISTLQAFCLCHAHDTWYSTAESQFVAQCMWPVMVAHSRKKGIGVLGKPDSETHQEEAWAAWAKDEERRRAAYCVLLIDTQLSAFWNQHCSRQLSIFAHHLTLPCPRRQWEAATARDWFRIRAAAKPSSTSGGGTSTSTAGATGVTPAPRHSKTQRSGYLPGLHPEFQVSAVADGYSSAILAALAVEKLTFKPDYESSLTVQMVLIGLIAIAWDCRTRGGMGIRFREGTKHWRMIVFKAVINLRASYEGDVPRMGEYIESKDLRDTFAICIISILSDIPMLHVAAGAATFCGSTIGRHQYSDAKRRLRLWAKTEDAWTCVWQCARFLRQSLFSEWGLYTPWAVFLTTLVCWAYHWTCKRDDQSAVGASPFSSRQKLPGSTDPRGHPHAAHAHGLPPAHLLPGHPQAPHAPPLQQDVIIQWLDKILATSGRVDLLDGEVFDLMDCVAKKLEMGEEIARENGELLGRLIERGEGGGAGRRR